jgi:hypothetical protein
MSNNAFLVYSLKYVCDPDANGFSKGEIMLHGDTRDYTLSDYCCVLLIETPDGKREFKIDMEHLFKLSECWLLIDH